MQLSINPATRCFAIHQKHQYCRKAKQSTKHDEQQQQFIIRLVKFKCYGMRFQMGVLLSQFLSGGKNAGEKIEDRGRTASSAHRLRWELARNENEPVPYGRALVKV
jgi:hypothetical protein